MVVDRMENQANMKKYDVYSQTEMKKLLPRNSYA